MVGPGKFSCSVLRACEQSETADLLIVYDGRFFRTASGLGVYVLGLGLVDLSMEPRLSLPIVATLAVPPVNLVLTL